MLIYKLCLYKIVSGFVIIWKQLKNVLNVCRLFEMKRCYCQMDFQAGWVREKIKSNSKLNIIDWEEKCGYKYTKFKMWFFGLCWCWFRWKTKCNINTCKWIRIDPNNSEVDNRNAFHCTLDIVMKEKWKQWKKDSNWTESNKFQNELFRYVS